MRGTRLRLALAVALVLQTCALYWPRVTVEGPVAWSDKVVHAALFGVPTLIGLYAVRSPRLLVGLLAAYAPVSELVQHWALPDRSGDPFDAMADLAGVLLGVVAWWGMRRGRREGVTA